MSGFLWVIGFLAVVFGLLWVMTKIWPSNGGSGSGWGTDGDTDDYADWPEDEGRK